MAEEVGTTLAEVYAAHADPAPLTIATAGALLELSMGLAAWKEYGPDKWALRCAPSSGNLHPTEAHIISRHVPGLDDGLYHCTSRDHALEQRCERAATDSAALPFLWVGLCSIQSREAWNTASAPSAIAGSISGMRSARSVMLPPRSAAGPRWCQASNRPR